MKVAKTWTEYWSNLVMQEVLGYLLGVVWLAATLVATFVFGFNWLWSGLVCAIGVTVAGYILAPYHPPGADGEWTKPVRPELQRRNYMTAAILAAVVLAILAAFFYTFFRK